jgi:hypothetical protein
MAAVALYVVARRGVHASLCWLVAGFMGAITFWYKYTSLPLLVFLFGAWALDEWRVLTAAALAGLARAGSSITSGAM